MKLLKKFLLCTLFLLSSFSLFSVEPDESVHGINLCDSLYSYLKENNTNPKIQNLVISGENNFPYNILISNNEDFSDISLKTDRIIFSFKMEEAWNNKEIILDLQKKLSDCPYKSTILILYDDGESFYDYHTINSCSVYLNSIDLNDNNIVYNFNFNQQENGIISGSKGFTSPSWMVHQVYNGLRASEIDFDFPFLYISQLSKFRFDTDKILSTFLQNEVSAITINFKSDSDFYERIENLFLYLIKDFETAKDIENDYHSLMLQFNNVSIWLSEITIIKIIIFIVFISLGFIFILGYINIQLQNATWAQLKKNWYTLIVTYILGVLAFFAGKGLFLLFYKNRLEECSVYTILVIQLIITITFLSIFYFLELHWHKKQYSGKSIDLLILLITFINQFVFCIVDISLFPIFMLICIFSVLSLIFSKNWTHIILLVLMIISAFAYASTLIQNSNTEELKAFIINSKNIPYVLTLILMPLYMMWFRILTDIQNKFSTLKISAIVMGSSYGAAILILIFTNIFYYSKFSNNDDSLQLITSDNDEDIYTLTYKDKFIFNELIRTIELTSKEEPVLIQITIEGQEAVPVLYSEYDFTIKSNKKAAIDIPLYPGRNINFSYGSNGGNEIISAKVIYNSTANDKSNFIVITDTIETEDLNAAE